MAHFSLHQLEIALKHIIFSLLLVCSSVFAQDSEWTKYGEGTEDIGHFKNGSYEPTKDGASVLIRFLNKYDKTVKFYRISMKTSECKSGIGQVIYSSISNKFLFNVDYVANGGTAAQVIGDILCSAIINKTNY